MMSTCEYCNRPFEPRQHNQRYCSAACNLAFYSTAREVGARVLRAGMTYHDLAQLDDDRPGGRFAGQSQRIVTGGPRGDPLPTANWATDPCGLEPAIEGNSDVLGVALGGEGGGNADAA
jgi:hypothetical protein